MNCQELISYLSAYLDNDLDQALRADAEAHLATCRNCHVVLDTTRQTILLYRECGSEGIPVERRDALYGRLLKALNQTTG
jgi:anti-sigma factor RsiW